MSKKELGRNVNDRNLEEELPPGLKALEAELSALCPRDDRLGRDRLIFLAGRASVARPPVGFGRWGWPGAFAGMTMVAATLLVMLLARPQPPAGWQAPLANEAGGVKGGAAAPSAAKVGAGGACPSGPVSGSSWTGALASAGLGGQPISKPPWFRTRAVYLERCQWMLAQGIDPWPEPMATGAEGPPMGAELPGSDESPHGPLPYHEWLKTLLEDQAHAELPSDWLDVPFRAGANS
jgi:hypothetical protein